MKTQLFTLLALASSAHLATATFDWLDAKKFTSPANTDNKCIDKQKSGFNWEGLDLGKFKDFADFEFDGFECADSFDGNIKRDLITGRTFQNKCIKGKATEDKSTAPSFGCGSSKKVDKFSVKEFQISVEYDTELEFHYDMPDGTVCKQKQSCKKSGTVVKNTQCGGAKKVKVTVPKGKGKGKDKGCNVGFHHIDFDCEPPKTPVKTPTPTPETTPVPETTPLPETTPTSPAETYATETPSQTPEVSETPSETEAIPVTTPAESTTSTASPVESTNPPFPLNTTSIPTGGETLPPVTHPATTILSTSVFTETRTNTITSCGEEVISCPAESTVITTETAVTSTVIPVTTTHAPEPTTVISVEHTTVIVETSTTICPVTSTFVDNGVTTIQTTLSTSTILISSTATLPVVSTPVETAPVETESESPVTTTTPSAPLPTADCPALLPQCLNTWVEVSGCKSNTDVECFCKSADFVENVYQCLTAHSASDEEVDKAQSFFQGICAVHIPENPAIITDVNTLTITATPLPTTVPVTTIELQTTIIVPCTETAGPSSGSLIPGSSTTQVISTAVTVPQVVFETITGTSTNVVSLVQGTPTAPAATSAVLTTFTTPLIVSPTTFASVSVPFGNSTTTASPPTFTGAASKNGLKAGSLVAAGLVALMAL